MAIGPEPQMAEAFAAETRRVMARRVPLGVGFFVGVVAFAGLLELVYYPQRLRALATTFAVELAVCAAAVLASRRERLRPHIIPITVAGTIAIGGGITLYVVVSGASGDALAFALIIFLTGVALLYPWGLAGQVPLVVTIVLAYVGALAAGVRGDLPLPYGIAAVLGGGVTSVIGAAFLDLHRRSIFQQRMLLERTRKVESAMLYEVTRTVTSTLDLQQVLHLVCEGVLHALGLERLWLFWRDAPGGDLRGLAATREGEGVRLQELGGDAGAWQPLLAAAAPAGPAVVVPGPVEAAALDPGAPLPERLLRVPLEFRSERVGVILADAGGRLAASRRGSANLVDVAATLGNSAAMAIGNARLYALLDQHRGELQRLSNKGLVVVEEIMRRISRELHDGTCQALMAIKLDLGMLERQLGDANRLRGFVRDIRAQVVDVMHGVRQMSHLIHPPVLDDFGAVAAIEAVAAKFRDSSGLQVVLDCSDPTMRFTPAVELLLFRVFQEALTNILKHASATRVDVHLGLDNENVVLDVTDDGRGFDAPAYFRSPPPSAGLGLLGMRERVGHLGGKFRITSRPGAGTRISVSVPANPVNTARVAAG
jgi:two-component system, NarL family, sensor kinase